MARANTIDAPRANSLGLGETDAPARQSRYSAAIRQAIRDRAAAEALSPVEIAELSAAVEAYAMTNPELVAASRTLEGIDERVGMNMRRIQGIDAASRRNTQLSQAITTVRQAVQQSEHRDSDEIDIWSNSIQIDGLSIGEYLQREGVPASLVDPSYPEGTMLDRESTAGVRISAESLDRAMETIRSEGTEISRSRDLVMMQLQNDVSERKRMVQLFSNLLKSFGDMSESIVGNVR